MTTRMRLNPNLLAAVVAVACATAAPQAWSQDGGAEIPFSITKFFIEFNATAGDVGVQVLLDGEPWNKLAMFSPNGRKILDIQGRRSLQLQGLTELFFESSEPSLAEFSLEEFLARFPAGEYDFEGETVDGIEMEGTAVFTHVIPAAPHILSPVSGTNDPPEVVPDNFLIEWDPVTGTIPPGGAVTIAEYQVIVEQVEPKRVFSINVPATVTSVKIPEEFFVQLGAVHKFEVLAIEAGGNQTITSGTFVPLP